MEKAAIKQGGGGMIKLPPGFRFHPTDEELIEQYLKRKVFCCPLPSFVIPEIQLSRFDPWDLPSDPTGENEKYFFSFRETRYMQGSHSNRGGATGYWKSTGKDGVISASNGGHVVGVKKLFVFYRGKPSRASRTDWFMHEYRLGGVAGALAGRLALQINNPSGHSLMEDWVLCRIFRKKRSSGRDGHEGGRAMERAHLPFVDSVAAEDGEAAELSCVTEENGDDEISGEDENCSSSSF